MVEFVVVAGLVFFPLLFGFIELGRTALAKTTVTAAAREGVRYAIVHGFDSPSVADSAAIANYVIARTKVSPIVVRSTWTPDKKHPSVATVQVSYNYVPIVPLFPSKTITSTSSQMIAF